MAKEIPLKPITRKALAYAEAGVAVFATTHDGKAPSISNKDWSAYLGRDVKRGEGGLHMASTDRENLIWQFERRASGGIGMPCGKVNGVIVADFDIHKEDVGGNAHKVMEKYHDEISEAHQVETRNGGVHAYFSYEPGHGKHELGENIEVQTDGSYVLLPPSKGYRVVWFIDREDWSPPPWDGVLPGVQSAEAAARRELSAETPPDVVAMAKILRDGGGGWHDAMVRIVAHLVGEGWTDAEILRFAPQWTQGGFTHAETFDEVCVAITGARTKWKRERDVMSTDQARLDRMGELWNRCSPAARKVFAQAVSDGGSDE